jgi:hypothetical protein
MVETATVAGAGKIRTHTVRYEEPLEMLPDLDRLIKFTLDQLEQGRLKKTLDNREMCLLTTSATRLFRLRNSIFKQNVGSQ